jgi:osmotically-inducible protein OsmY
MPNRSHQQNRSFRSDRSRQFNVDHSGGFSRQSSEQRLPNESHYDDEREPRQWFDRSEEMGSSRMSGERSRWGSAGGGYGQGEEDRLGEQERGMFGHQDRWSRGGPWQGQSSGSNQFGGGYGQGRFGGGSYGNQMRSQYGGGQYGNQMGGHDAGYGQERFGSQFSNQFGNQSGGYNQDRSDLGSSQRTGRGPKGYTRSDDRIREDICDRLSDGRFDCSDVDVSVSNGEVTLSGSVSDRQTKYHLEELSDRIGGVKDVHNQLSIKRESTQGNIKGEKNSEGNGGRRGSSGPAH